MSQATENERKHESCAAVPACTFLVRSAFSSARLGCSRVAAGGLGGVSLQDGWMGKFRTGMGIQGVNSAHAARYACFAFVLGRKVVELLACLLFSSDTTCCAQKRANACACSHMASCVFARAQERERSGSSNCSRPSEKSARVDILCANVRVLGYPFGCACRRTSVCLGAMTSLVR